MAQTQRALVVEKIGAPLVLRNDFPVPEPGPNQVQVKVTVAGINPHDQKSRDSGLFISEHLPAVLANDVVGTVSKIGPGVTSLSVGDRILAHAQIAGGSTQPGLQEYSIADVAFSLKIPASISDDQAATLPTNIVAPLVALFGALGIPAPWTPEAEGFDYAGTALLIMGGGSACGKFGVQLSKLAGIGKIVVVGGPKPELVEYGATHIIDRHDSFEGILGHIRAVVGDDLVYAYDPINPPDGQILALNALSSSRKGALARLLPLGPVDDSKVLGKKAGYDVLNVLGSSHAQAQLAVPFWERLGTYLEEGKIRPLTYVTKHGLDASIVNEVLDAYRDNKPITKTHVHI